MGDFPWSAAQAAASAKLEPVTRSEIAEALTHAVHAARRTFRVVGSADYPTPWDRQHAYIDNLLWDYFAASD